MGRPGKTSPAGGLVVVANQSGIVVLGFMPSRQGIQARSWSRPGFHLLTPRAGRRECHGDLASNIVTTWACVGRVAEDDRWDA